MGISGSKSGWPKSDLFLFIFDYTNRGCYYTRAPWKTDFDHLPKYFIFGSDAFLDFLAKKWVYQKCLL